MYVGDAVKAYGTHERRKRTVIGITPWGLIENHTDLIGQDVSLFFLSHYKTYILYGQKHRPTSVLFSLKLAPQR